jgi:hypothetical protein
MSIEDCSSQIIDEHPLFQDTLRHTWVCSLDECDGEHHLYVAA